MKVIDSAGKEREACWFAPLNAPQEARTEFLNWVVDNATHAKFEFMRDYIRVDGQPVAFGEWIILDPLEIFQSPQFMKLFSVPTVAQENG